MGQHLNRSAGAPRTSSVGAPVVFTIYCHTHAASKRRYVGLTKLTMMKRWNQHVRNAKKKPGRGCFHFWNAIRAYGKAAFDHEVLQICSSLGEANAAEEKWIAHFNTRDPLFGFNIKKGGDHVPHPIRNPWDRPGFRERGLAFLAKANDISPEERSARSKSLWSDPEFADKVVTATRAAKSTPDGKARASAAVREWRNRPGMREKYSDLMKEQWASGPRREIDKERRSDLAYVEACSIGLRRGAALNASKTHCRNGHEYSPENTKFDKKGSRLCITCVRTNSARNARRYRIQEMT